MTGPRHADRPSHTEQLPLDPETLEVAPGTVHEGMQGWVPALATEEELRIARNEIFARRGRYFEAADLKTRFERFSWYSPRTWNPKLNSVEQANVALMDQVEKR